MKVDDLMMIIDSDNEINLKQWNEASGEYDLLAISPMCSNKIRIIPSRLEKSALYNRYVYSVEARVTDTGAAIDIYVAGNDGAR